MSTSVRGCESLLEIIKKFDQRGSAARKIDVTSPTSVKEEWKLRHKNMSKDKTILTDAAASTYEELNLSRPSEQQLYKNDKNFTLSVKELQFGKKPKSNDRLKPLDLKEATEVDPKCKKKEGKALAEVDKFTKLHFDIVTLGSSRKKSSDRIVWSKSKTLLLMWTIVALVLWVVTYMILRLVYVI